MKNKNKEWVDRLNEAREHKGDIPNNLFWRYIAVIIGVWVVVWLLMWAVMNS